jgi:hypothetical protein
MGNYHARFLRGLGPVTAPGYLVFSITKTYPQMLWYRLRFCPAEIVDSELILRPISLDFNSFLLLF